MSISGITTASTAPEGGDVVASGSLVGADARVLQVLDHAPEPGILSAAMTEIRALCSDLEDMPGKLDDATFVRLVPEMARGPLRHLSSIFADPMAMASACENYFSAEDCEAVSYRILIELFGYAPCYATRPERLAFAGVLHSLVGLEPRLIVKFFGVRDTLVADLRMQGFADTAARIANDFSLAIKPSNLTLPTLFMLGQSLVASQDVVTMIHPDFKPSTGTRQLELL